VPIGLLGIVLVTRYIEEMREPARSPFDLLGLVLAGTALASFMFGIEMGSRGVGSRTLALALVSIGIVSAGLYALHARRHPQPMLDFRMMRIPTFRLSVLCGSCSRIAVGAMPFLLPMMLQLGFGLSAAQSGLITFVSSLGSLGMRLAAPVILRRLGFRNVLMWIGLVATLLLAASAGFRPSWPIAAIYFVLLLNGFFQSLQFMAYNTIAYADVPRPQMSTATSFYTTFQQMSLTLGIAMSAATLAASEKILGHTVLMLSDFSVAFLAVATVSLAAPLLSRGFDRSAGAELSGHRDRPAKPRIVVAE